MIYDGTNLEAVRKMARGGRLFAVVWTWRTHMVVRSKKDGHTVMRRWKEMYEADGWTVVAWANSQGDAYLATSPDGERHCCSIHEYNAETLERVHREFKPKQRYTPREPAKRRGRKPVYA